MLEIFSWILKKFKPNINISKTNNVILITGSIQRNSTLTHSISCAQTTVFLTTASELREEEEKP